jgi:hypothetical protein
MDKINTESIINAVHNEPNIWQTNRNASEEDKDLAYMCYYITPNDNPT